MAALQQFAYDPESTVYRFAHNSVPEPDVVDAPNDADFSRSAMLYDGAVYRLYLFAGGARDALYQFAWDDAAYRWGHRSLKRPTISGIPDDADVSTFAMLHDGEYRLYMRKLGARALYQFVFNGSEYAFGAKDAFKQIKITGFPCDADLFRWDMLHDGENYRFYCFSLGSNSLIYQGAFNSESQSYEFGYQSIPKIHLEDAPDSAQFTTLNMLNDGSHYRLYLNKKE